MPHSVTEAIEAFAKGEIVIVTDDDDRENEGDLICAAIHCTPEKMAFIIRNTCGIVCAPLSSDTAKRLHLTPMVASNDAPLGTATVPYTPPPLPKKKDESPPAHTGLNKIKKVHEDCHTEYTEVAQGQTVE